MNKINYIGLNPELRLIFKILRKSFHKLSYDARVKLNILCNFDHKFHFSYGLKT